MPWPHYDGIGDTTLQVILFEGSNNILFQYADVDFGDPAYDFGASATVGLNMNDTTAEEYSFNTASLADSMAILWTPATPGMASDMDTAEVLLADPDIDVTPASLMASQMTNTTTMQSLTIANVGDNVLDWTIDEDPDDGVFPPMGQAGSGDSSTFEEDIHSEIPKQEAPWTANPPVWERSRFLLYDNGPLVNCPGCGSGGADESQLQGALGMTTLGLGHQLTAGNRIADDFEVPAGGWFIQTITFFAYQTGSTTTSTMTGVNLQIGTARPTTRGAPWSGATPPPTS